MRPSRLAGAAALPRRLDRLMVSTRPQQVVVWLVAAYCVFIVGASVLEDRTSGAPFADSLLALSFLVLPVGLLLREPWRAWTLLVSSCLLVPALDRAFPHLRAEGSALFFVAGLLITAFVLGYDRRLKTLAFAIAVWATWSLSDEIATRVDGFTVQFVIPMSLLFGIAGWSVGYVVRRRRAAEDELADLAERRRRERLGLARELHDSVARDLTIIAMQSAVLRTTDRPDEQEYAREAIETTARSGLDALKRLLVVLRAQEAVDAPELVRDLEAEDLGGALRESTRHLVFLGFQVTASDAPTDLPRAAETTAVRVVREGTTNITKHAPAGALCRLDCTREGGDLVVRVENRLDGHASSSRTPSTGVGLDSLAERLRLLGGTLDHGEHDGRWILQARIPLTAPLAGSVGPATGS